MEWDDEHVKELEKGDRSYTSSQLKKAEDGAGENPASPTKRRRRDDRAGSGGKVRADDNDGEEALADEELGDVAEGEEEDCDDGVVGDGEEAVVSDAGDGEGLHDVESGEEDNEEDDDDEDAGNGKGKKKALCPHATARKEADTIIAGLVGDKVTVTSGRGKKTKDVWTVVKPSNKDDLPQVPGTKKREDKGKGMNNYNKTGAKKVFNDFTVGSGPDALLGVLLHLYPGDIKVHVKRINKALEGGSQKVRNITVGEYVKWLGVFLAARLYDQKGANLWDTRNDWGVTQAPDFKRFFPQRRFEAIKAVVHCAFGEEKADDPWGLLRPTIDEFNKNRLRTIVSSTLSTADESMSAYVPRTSKTGTLPHLSFISRKPKPLGKGVRGGGGGEREESKYCGGGILGGICVRAVGGCVWVVSVFVCGCVAVHVVCVLTISQHTVIHTTTPPLL